MCKDIKEEASPYAEEGTNAHRVVELMATEQFVRELSPAELEELAQLTSKDPEFYANGLVYMSAIKKVIDEAGCKPEFFALEHKLLVEDITTEAGAMGTADLVMLVNKALWVVDYKYGKGVPVAVERNPQLAIYALAAYDELSMIYDIETIHLMIVQPRCGGVATWEFPKDVWDLFRKNVQTRGRLAMDVYQGFKPLEGNLKPSDEGCRFCRAKAICPKLKEHVEQAIVADFSAEGETGRVVEFPLPKSAEDLAKVYTALPLVEQWVTAVRESMIQRLTAGEDIKGYKLVAGKPGNRKWRDEAEAEQMLKTMRIKEPDMYQRKLISPTTAEKLSKQGIIGPRQWPRLSELIVRADGKPIVVPEDDERPRLNPSTDDFQALED